MITNNLCVISAVCGNFWRESTVNPGIWESLTVGAPGYGLGQWTDLAQYGLTRRTQMFNWLAANGYPQDSGPGQLAYLVHEDYWTPASIQPSAYNTLTDFFASTSTNVQDLTLEYMFHWEGINDSSQQIRIDAANAYYNLFVNDPGTRNPWTAGNFYCSTAQANNNALLIMDWFLGSTPPGPGPGGDDFLALLALAVRRRRKWGYNVQ